MKKEQYIKEVLKNINTYRDVKKRIKEDLYSRIEEALDRDPYFDFVQELGTPQELAEEFMENLTDPSAVKYKGFNGMPYEYKSTKKIFGLPLIHVNTGGRYGASVAKGIIAVGDVSVGIISIGGVSCGVISIGGISLGAVALGGVAIGGLAFGGVAIGIVSFGGVAYGLLKAIGGAMGIL